MKHAAAPPEIAAAACCRAFASGVGQSHSFVSELSHHHRHRKPRSDALKPKEPRKKGQKQLFAEEEPADRALVAWLRSSKSIMGDVGVICHTIYVSNLNEKIKKPLLKKSLHRCADLIH